MPDDGLNEIEEAQASLRDGIERAQELICEAKLALRQRRGEESQSPELGREPAG
jgi:hypothetical protein